MMVTPFGYYYRGFMIGFIQGLHGYRAAWKSSLESEWQEGHIYVDQVDQVEKLAEECIDFNYLVEAREAALGRKLTMEEICEMRDEK